jgi:hypothetical protein
MRLRSVVAIAGLSLCLASCYDTYGTARSASLPSPAAISADGTYTHAPSGMTFPMQVGDFQRVSLLRYDTEGLDMSAGYNLAAPTTSIVGTVYIYPAPPLTSIGSPASVVSSARVTLCKNEFDGRKQEIARYHPRAALLDEKDVSLPLNGAPFPGKMAAFEFDETYQGTRQTLRSELYVFCCVGNKWAFEYRFTAPKSIVAQDMIHDTITDFMTKLPWTVKTTP